MFNEGKYVLPLATGRIPDKLDGEDELHSTDEHTAQIERQRERAQCQRHFVHHNILLGGDEGQLFESHELADVGRRDGGDPQQEDEGEQSQQEGDEAEQSEGGEHLPHPWGGGESTLDHVGGGWWRRWSRRPAGEQGHLEKKTLKSVG
jgi:hypothetical protein